MKNEKFYKQYGAEAEQSQLVVLSDERAVVFYGFGKDEEEAETGWNWRKDYDHVPSLREIRQDIEALINERVEERILSGMRWEEKPVWLSEENQLNFRSAVSVPVRFKLGEDAEGKPVYHTFKTQKELTAFNKAVADWVNGCLNEGWDEKDGVDYTVYAEER